MLRKETQLTGSSFLVSYAYRMKSQRVDTHKPVLDMEQREGFEGVGPWYTSQVSRTSEFQQACQQNGVNRGTSFLGLVLSVQGKTRASLC